MNSDRKLEQGRTFSTGRERLGWLRLLCAMVVLGLGGGQAWALGLLVIKGANASPEFAKVLPFSRCEEFAVNYKVQVMGEGERVFLISEVFGMVEYDPVLLAGNLVDILDYAPLLDVVERTRALEARYPAVRQESPRFLKPILEVLALKDQGMVQYEGRWLTQQRYRTVIEDQRQKVKDTRAMAEAIERTKKLEIQNREAEARAMIHASEDRVKAELRAREEEENQRRAAMKKVAEQQEKEAALLVEKQRQEELQRQQLQANWAAVGPGSQAALLKAEWETLMGWHKSGKRVYAGFDLPKAAQVLLFKQHFNSELKALPSSFGQGSVVQWAESAGGGRFLIHVETPASPEVGVEGGASRHAGLMAFTLPADARGGPVAGNEAREITAVLGDVSKDLARALPRAVATCLTSLPRAGALSRRVPLVSGGIEGYVTVTRPLLGDDGTYHLVVLVALGLTDGAEEPLNLD